MKELPDGVKELLAAPNFAHIATLMPDGSPQNTVVWVDIDGDYILVNTAAGRRKIENIQADPRIALSITDANQPYRWAQIRGKVVDVIADGADAHIDKMAMKYLGKSSYPFRQPGEQRRILKIEPLHVSVSG